MRLSLIYSYFSNSKVGVVDKNLYSIVVLYLRINLFDKPFYQLLVAFYSCAVVAKEINAEIFKMLFGGGYVAQNSRLGCNRAGIHL